MSNRIQLGHADQLYVRNLYLCVYLCGRDLDDEPCYAYFGIFLDKFLKMWADIQEGQAVNPKDYEALVLARAVGSPGNEVLEFMCRKFSFSLEPNEVVLEISRPESKFSGQMKRREKFVPKSSYAESEKPSIEIKDEENDFPFAASSVTETRIGSAHAEITANQEDAIHSLMQKLVNAVNGPSENESEPQVEIVHQ